MVLSPEGKRLSKREGALDINEYKKMGYLKEAMINYLIKLGWTYKEQEIFSEEELIKYFDIQNVNSSAAKFSQKLLDFYNNYYLKESDLNSLYAYIDTNFSLSDKESNLDRAPLILNEPVFCLFSNFINILQLYFLEICSENEVSVVFKNVLILL